MNVLYPLDRYDLDAYMRPYWDGGVVYQEAVLPLRSAGGDIEDIRLLYDADRILSLRSADLQTRYREGRDYQLAGGKLIIPKGSAIAGMPHELYYPPTENECCKRLCEHYGTGYIFFTESSLMHRLQLAVTYTHRDTFGGTVPACKRPLLPRTHARLKNGEALALCVFGDSICVGGNSSAFLGVPPMAKPWHGMFYDQLRKTYPDSAITFRNVSLGGKDSGWGAETAAERAGYGPDLCIIGFGMNDGTRRVSPEVYQRNIRAIMETVSAGNPDCEFVLIATTLPNPMVGRFYGCQEDYLPMLQALERPGVAVADMTGLHKYLLTRKRFCDMSANNVNHPNDFLARAYAQLLWQTVVGY